MFFRNAFIFTRDASFVHGSFRVENGKFAEVFARTSTETALI